MIDWLMMQLPGLCLLLVLLVACYPLAIRYLGVGYYYALWLFVPFQLLFTHSQIGGAILTDTAISHYVVSGQQSFSALQNSTAPFAIELYLIWGTGALLLTLFGLWQHQCFMRRLNLRPYEARLPEVLIPRAVGVFSSDVLHSPMVTGLLRPKLILPVGFNAQSEKMQKLMLQHELVHLSRRDLWWNALAILLLIVFWFNPLSWVAYRYFRQTQELACDARVLAKQDMPTRLLYAKSFVGQAVQQQRLTFTSLYYGGKQNMKDRIHNMRSNSKSLLKVLPLAAVLLACMPLSQAISGQKVQKTDLAYKVHPVKRIEPYYPKEAAEQGIEGSVVLQFSVKTDGAVENVKVIRSQPESVFDESASQALAQWRYREVDKQVDNLLVQLDFVLGPDSKANLLANMEQINVTPHKQK